MDISKEIKEYLKQNLSIEVEVEKEYDLGNTYHIVTSKLLLDGEVISEDSDYLREG